MPRTLMILSGLWFSLLSSTMPGSTGSRIAGTHPVYEDMKLTTVSTGSHHPNCPVLLWCTVHKVFFVRVILSPSKVAHFHHLNAFLFLVVVVLVRYWHKAVWIVCFQHLHLRIILFLLFSFKYDYSAPKSHFNNVFSEKWTCKSSFHFCPCSATVLLYCFLVCPSD